MFYYQAKANASSVAMCGREAFWGAVKSPQTQWKIDTRRAVLKAVAASRDGEGAAAIEGWLRNTDYQRFVAERPRSIKSKGALEAWNAKDDCERLLAWADELKQSLTAFIFSCYEFDEREQKVKGGGTVRRRRRKLKDCHVNGLVMLDLDHVENPMRIWWKLREMKTLLARTVLVHFTTTGDGLRIVFTVDITQGNLADNQIEMALALGCKPDSSCIDATRISFTPKEEEILYIDEERLFNYYDEEFDKAYTPKYRLGQTQPENHEGIAVGGTGRGRSDKAGTMAGGDALQGSGDGQPVADKEVVNDKEAVRWAGEDLQPVLDAWSAARFGDGQMKASRHDASVVLAHDLYIMFDRDRRRTLAALKAQTWVKEIIRERDEDVERTVDDAAAYVAAQESAASKAGKRWLPKPSQAMQDAIEKGLGLTYDEIMEAEATLSPSKGAEIDARLEQWGAEIESLFGDFPMLKDVCSGLRRSQYPTALFVAGGTLMTDMTRCWYRFYHRPQQEQRLNCSLFIIGHPASNKSMADDIYEILSEPIAEADKAGKSALNAYKQKKTKKAANKEGDDKPQGIIRIHPARTSNGQLIQDMLNAHEIVDGREMQLHMLTFDTELDNATTLQSGGSWINKMSMELKAFHNEKDGQMYQNSDSPVDEFRVTWNYIYTGTPIALKRKVNERNFGSGLSTRLAVIPVPKTNFEMIPYEDEDLIDWDRIDRMKAWAYKLDRRAGQLPMKRIVRSLWEWTKNRMDDCREDHSEASELMLKRVAYHALNYAAPFIDMRHFGDLRQEDGFWKGTYETDETDWKLCELIARIQYATQQHFFGKMAENYFDGIDSEETANTKRHYKKSVDGYNRLPEVFTKEDVAKCFGYDKPRAIDKKLERLQSASYIIRIKEGENIGKFQKVVKAIS